MSKVNVAELFAGVGGFRLGLEGYRDPAHPGFDLPAAGPFETVWANQWEPPGTESRQFAWRCYERRFGRGGCVNDDIGRVLDLCEAGRADIPNVDMVVGGFPCQDYSVAKPLSKSDGIEGRKGVLWWDIHRLLRLKGCPKRLLLENVDRLPKSPASQRGRDFAIILTCLADLGYSVEWRVADSSAYGFPQRRRRIYIYAEHGAGWDLGQRMADGVMARALPMEPASDPRSFPIPEDPFEVTRAFNVGGKASPFSAAGAMQGCEVLTCDIAETWTGGKQVLGNVLVPKDEVPDAFRVPDGQLPRWEYLKGAKREPRVDKRTGHEYFYSEGAMAFPDALGKPSRTILTSEGGSGPSRSKHVVDAGSGLRRLVPDELERLQGFPRGWTDTGMTDAQRAFCMGNALVVGMVRLIGRAIAESL